MQLSIVLPAYNEESRLASSLEKILEFCERELSEWEVIVVDDGSTDRTAAVAESFEGVRCVRNGVNRGKGRSVERGVMEAACDPVMFTDVDLSTPVEESLGLLRAIREGADLAIASRRPGGEKVVSRRLFRRFQARVFNWIVRLLVVRGIRDTQCGFKMFRREVARRVFPMQRLERWAFDVEILFISRRLGYTIREVPVEWHESSESRLTRWSPFQMLFDLLLIRWYQLTGGYRLRG